MQFHINRSVWTLFASSHCWRPKWRTLPPPPRKAVNASVRGVKYELWLVTAFNFLYSTEKHRNLFFPEIIVSMRPILSRQVWLPDATVICRSHPFLNLRILAPPDGVQSELVEYSQALAQWAVLQCLLDLHIRPICTGTRCACLGIDRGSPYILPTVKLYLSNWTCVFHWRVFHLPCDGTSCERKCQYYWCGNYKVMTDLVCRVYGVVMAYWWYSITRTR